MTKHLLNQTLSREQSALAHYYNRTAQGLSQEDRDMELVASLVVSGQLEYRDAIESYLSAWRETGGAHVPERPGETTKEYFARLDDAERAEEGRLERALDRALGRLDKAYAVESVAVIRPDLHPLVAKGLGINPDGTLTKDHVNGLLAGRRTDGGKIEGKHYAAIRSMGEDQRTGERRLSTPIGSYDFCPSPDKSVSVSYSFAPPAQQAAIYNAHIQAARDAVAYIEREIGRARIGEGGKEGHEPGHVGWLEFTHYTARKARISVGEGGAAKVELREIAGDPELHTHFLIPNAVFCESGRVGSLDTARIGGFLFEAGAFYQARLAQNLRDAGFAVELDPQTGSARMTAVPEEIRRLFSKRTNSGEALAKQFTRERGEVWEELSQEQREARIKAATQDKLPAWEKDENNRAKGYKDDVANVDDWRRQAKAAGWDPPSNFLSPDPPKPELSREDRLKLAYDMALPFLEEQFGRKAVLTNWDVRVAAARGLVHAGIRDGVDDINAVTQLMRENGVRQYGEVTPLIWGREGDGRTVKVTTGLHEAQEREFISLAKSAAADRSAAIPSRLLDRTIKESGLDFTGEHGKAQLKAIRQMGEGGRFGVMIAAAGAGKTTALKPLVAAWREQGREVYAASLAWRQADDLPEAGIARTHAKAFSVLVDAARAGQLNLNPKSVVCIDELGLLGTAQGLELLRLRERYGFSIVALGDDKQCQAVQAGAIIDLCRRALGAEHVPEILTTVRQQTDREKQIVALFREGRAREAIDMKRADGTAELTYGDYSKVASRVAALYAERFRETGQAPSVAAPTNADAHRIGEAIRRERRALGLVGENVRTLSAKDGDGRTYDLPLAVGDQVRLFRSTGADFGAGRGGSIGRNGSVLEIQGIDHVGIKARSLKTGRVGHVKWRDLIDKDGRTMLAYGYALTIDSSQGLTAKEHILALPSGSQAINGLKAYSGGTRHRQRSWLIVSEYAEREEVRRRRPLNDAREITTDDKWANVTRNLIRQPEKDTAIGLMERAGWIKRGTVRMFQQSLMPSEQAVLRGRAPSHIHDTAHERRIAPTMERIAEYARRVPEMALERARGWSREIGL